MSELTGLRMVDGGLTDPGLPDPLPRVIALLSDCKDRVLIQRYGIWLIRHNPAAALDVSVSRQKYHCEDTEYFLY